tara:strand:+ start:464 stop:823 length:360 start_codon:yes stop_codon:yes gene_type:complete
MKVTPIDERLRNALCHVCAVGEHMADEVESFYKDDFDVGHSAFADYPHMDGLRDSLTLLREYVSCFGADGSVAQRGQIPKAWNPETIFESEKDYKLQPVEEVSPEEKDANAKKLLEELT